MSQAKVDRYKEEKANRKKTLKKQKLMQTIYTICGSVICLAIVGWIGYSAYGYFRTGDNDAAASRTEVNVDALNDYLNTLQTADSAE